MRISKEQMETFDQKAVENFENGLAVELGAALPKVRELMGADRFLAKVRAGAARAREHGLVSRERASVCLRTSPSCSAARSTGTRRRPGQARSSAIAAPTKCLGWSGCTRPQ